MNTQTFEQNKTQLKILETKLTDLEMVTNSIKELSPNNRH